MSEGEAREALSSLRGSARPRILLVSHGERGGVTRHVDDLVHSFSAVAELLLLRPMPPGSIALTWERDGRNLALYFDAAHEWDALVRVLEAIGVDRLHLHHVDGLPRAVLDLPTRLACAYDVTLHDYYAACPNYHLVDASGRYCARDPDCRQCTESKPAQWAGSIDDWRGAFDRFLAGAARVIAPSADMAVRIARFFPGIRTAIWPHPEDEPRVERTRTRVLVPGAISHAKGMDLLDACIEDAVRRALPLHFRVLGFVARKLPSWPEGPVSICGEYPEGRLDELIAIEGGHVCFFPAQCPESFSFTLSAALDSGLPVVATDLGALPERLAGAPGARVVSWNATPAAINDALLGAARRPEVERASPERPRMTHGAYRERYFSGLPAGTRGAQAELPPLQAGWLAGPPTPSRVLPLAYLYEDGVVCGKAESLERLRRYAFDPDSLYADADARVRELIEARAALEERVRSLEQARARGLGASLRGFLRWIRGLA